MNRSSPIRIQIVIDLCGSTALCLAALLLTSSLAAAEPAKAGDYEIDWTCEASGGVEATGGDFALLPVIGQPIGNLTSGGDFEVEPGYLNEDTASVPVELVSFTIE